MEEKSRKRSRNQRLQALVLASVAIAGGLAVALVAPNVLGAMRKLGLMPKDRQSEYVHAARRRLKREGLLFEQNGFLRLTPQGEKQLRAMSLSLAKPKRPRKWDEKWRILIFDIPERRRHIRDKVRELLRGSGFVRVQDSVWLYPHPCEEFVALLKAEVRIGKDMLYVIVDSLEGDAKFRELFKLPAPPYVPPPPPELPGIAGAVLDTILPRPDRIR
jgi:hypothetical protein